MAFALYIHSRCHQSNEQGVIYFRGEGCLNGNIYSKFCSAHYEISRQQLVLLLTRYCYTKTGSACGATTASRREALRARLRLLLRPDLLRLRLEPRLLPSLSVSSGIRSYSDRLDRERDRVRLDERSPERVVLGVRFFFSFFSVPNRRLINLNIRKQRQSATTTAKTLITFLTKSEFAAPLNPPLRLCDRSLSG